MSISPSVVSTQDCEFYLGKITKFAGGLFILDRLDTLRYLEGDASANTLLSWLLNRLRIMQSSASEMKLLAKNRLFWEYSFQDTRAALGMGEARLRTALKKLQEVGLIDVQRRWGNVIWLKVSTKKLDEIEAGDTAVLAKLRGFQVTRDPSNYSYGDSKEPLSNSNKLNSNAQCRGGLAPSGDGADPVPANDWDNTNSAFVPATSTNGQHYHTSQDAQRAPGTKNNTRHNANSSQSAARGPKPNTTEQDITVARALLAAALRKVNRLTTPAEVPGWADAVAVLRRKLQLTPERLHRVLVEGYANHVDRIDKPIIDCKKKISPDVFNWLAEQADKLLPPPPVELTEDARKVLDQLANCRFPVPQQTLGVAVQRSLDAYRAHCNTVRQVAADHPRQPGKRSHPATVYAEDLAGAVPFVTRWFDSIGSYLGQHPDRAGDFIKVYTFTPHRDQYTAMGVKSMTEYYGGGGPARWQELIDCCRQYEDGIR